ncbi:hypothetical protein C8F01DRAFT_1172990 [Mycena amicta]|nr:hypothetical protein C8F01DRAFT_1172990 [Mycena amicta]
MVWWPFRCCSRTPSASPRKPTPWFGRWLGNGYTPSYQLWTANSHPSPPYSYHSTHSPSGWATPPVQYSPWGVSPRRSPPTPHPWTSDLPVVPDIPSTFPSTPNSRHLSPFAAPSASPSRSPSWDPDWASGVRSRRPRRTSNSRPSSIRPKIARTWGVGDMPSLISPNDLQPRPPAVFMSPPPLSPYASPAPHGHDNWTNTAFPFHNSPSPQQYAYSHAVLLHPHLSNMPGQFPFLSWDIIKFPSTALYHAHPSARPVAYPLENSTEPATHPPSTYLTISFADNPRLAQLQSLWGGPIRVRTTGAGPITLENVLAAIHGYFRQRITRTQKMYMREGEWDAASMEYYRRLARRDIPDLRGVAEARGVLRSDVLGGATRFAGLRIMGAGREWLYLTLTR